MIHGEKTKKKATPGKFKPGMASGNKKTDQTYSV